MNKIESALSNVINKKGEPNGTASLNADGIIPVSQLPINLKECKVVANMTERDALEKFEGLRVMVMDATTDPTVGVGWAEYVWDGLIWIKAAEMESLDLVLSWENVIGKPTEFPPIIHKHAESDITDLDKYTKAETDGKLATKSDVGHGHAEFQQFAVQSGRLDKLETSAGQIHSHANKSALDKIIYSGALLNIDLIALEELLTHTHSYASLTGKPTIPTQTSQLTNNSSFLSSNATKMTVSSTAPLAPSPNDIWIVI